MRTRARARPPRFTPLPILRDCVACVTASVNLWCDCYYILYILQGLSELIVPHSLHFNMHRDIARLLVFLAVVRVLTVVACPAPAPPPTRLFHREADRQLRHQATRRRPAIPRPIRDLSQNRDFLPVRWGNSPPDTASTPSLPLPYQCFPTATTPEPLHPRTFMGGSPSASPHYSNAQDPCRRTPEPHRTLQTNRTAARVSPAPHRTAPPAAPSQSLGQAPGPSAPAHYAAAGGSAASDAQTGSSTGPAQPGGSTVPGRSSGNVRPARSGGRWPQPRP